MVVLDLNRVTDIKTHVRRLTEETWIRTLRFTVDNEHVSITLYGPQELMTNGGEVDIQMEKED